MAEYEEFAASVGYDSDDSDGGDTDEEVKNSFVSSAAPQPEPSYHTS